MARDLLIRDAPVLDGSGRKPVGCIRVNAATPRDRGRLVGCARGQGRAPDRFDA